MRRAIYDACLLHISEKGHGPSYQWICDNVGLYAKSTVRFHLDKLRDRGLLTFVDGQIYSIKILRDYDTLEAI